MNKLFPILLLVSLLGAGCKGVWPFGKSAEENSARGFSDSVTGTSTNSVAAKPGELIVTPENSVTGKVVRYNDAGRFVVLDFPIAHMPPVDKQMFVYRNGLKVGEIRITGPQRENHTVADLLVGEAQPNDEVRDR